MTCRVAVIMSTYNGQLYINQQISSILHQKDVEIDIYIRDDGSKDLTVSLIRHLQQNHSNIYLYTGDNLGYKKSFLRLLTMVPNTYDYYAFSDQDDVWLDNKIQKACKKMQQSSIALYCSALTYVDDKLSFIRQRDYSINDIGLEKTFARMRFAGCTMVFTKGLFEIAVSILKKDSDNVLVSHDLFILSLCEAVKGEIFLDENSYILYRRTQSNLTAGGSSALQRIGYEYKRITTNDRLDLLAKALLKNKIYAFDTKHYLESVSKYRTDIWSRINLIISVIKLRYNWILKAEAIIKIMISTF